MVYMSSRTNRTNFYLVTASTGETFPEKARATVGGFSNMLARVAGRFGGNGHPANMVSTDTGAGFVYTMRDVEGVSFTLEQVEKL